MQVRKVFPKYLTFCRSSVNQFSILEDDLQNFIFPGQCYQRRRLLKRQKDINPVLIDKELMPFWLQAGGPIVLSLHNRHLNLCKRGKVVGEWKWSCAHTSVNIWHVTQNETRQSSGNACHCFLGLTLKPVHANTVKYIRLQTWSYTLYLYAMA